MHYTELLSSERLGKKLAFRVINKVCNYWSPQIMTETDILDMQAKILSLLDDSYNHKIRESREAKADSLSFFSDVLSTFINLEFTEKQAIIHWKEILANYDKDSRRLGRKIGLHTAIVDYFTNLLKILESPFLVEQKLFEKTKKFAMVDSLTGTYNRRYMETCLKKEIMRCERYKKNASVCILDIDNFKNINDTYGHQTGDDILVNFASQIKKSIREEDVLCRYGGEEFLVILPETCINGAKNLAERIQNSIFTDPLLKHYKITFSAGIASYPCNGKTIEELISIADSFLYKAKKEGRNRIELAYKNIVKTSL